VAQGASLPSPHDHGIPNAYPTAHNACIVPGAGMHRTKAAGLALGFFLAGCAAQVELAPEQRQAVKSVSVAPAIAMPEMPRVFASDSSTGMLFLGPLGMLAASASSEQPRQFKDFLASSGIDVREVVRGEFLRQTAQAQRFPQIVEHSGDAVVQLDIEDYGLAPGFSLRPIDKPLSATLRVAARMTTADGKLLWQKTELVSNLNPDTESQKFDAWLSDRALAERGFRKAAEIVVAGLLSEFTAAPEPARLDASGQPRPVTPLSGPDAKRFERGHDSGGNIRFESEPGGDGRCTSRAACGGRDPAQVNK
jgi:hypothetical protein